MRKSKKSDSSNSAIRIETDVLPTNQGSKSYDFTSLLLTKQVNRSLFKEKAGNLITGDLIKKAYITGESEWTLEVSDEAEWSTGKTVTSNEVLQQMRSIVKHSKFKFLLKPIDRIEAVTSKKLIAKTHLPIDLPALFSNPVFAPESTDLQVTTGEHYIRDRSPGRIELGSNVCGPDIEFVLANDAESGQMMYDRGETDITCSTTFPLMRWKSSLKSDEIFIHPLNITVDVIVPQSFHPDSARLISSRIDRTEITKRFHGLVEPINTATDMWRREKLKEKESNGNSYYNMKTFGEQELYLYYPDFSPNKELAESFCQHIRDVCGLLIKPVPQTYKQYLTDGIQVGNKNFRLVLRASPWPDPLSMIIPYLNPVNKDTRSTSFVKEIIYYTDKADNSEQKLSFLEKASIEIENKNGIVPIARLNSITRSRYGSFHSPPSGWVKYSENTSYS